jgi:hypothetical protein
VIVIDADLLPSATDVAVKFTVAGFGGAVGAVYVTDAPDALVAGDTAPHVAPLQPAPESAQLTPLAAESLATVAVTVCVAPACTVAVVVATVTAISACGGVVPPPPVLLVTPPEQPMPVHKARRVAMPLRQRASLVQDRFTVKSPKLMVLFLELSAPVGGAMEQLLVYAT